MHVVILICLFACPVKGILNLSLTNPSNDYLSNGQHEEMSKGKSVLTSNLANEDILGKYEQNGNQF